MDQETKKLEAIILIQNKLRFNNILIGQYNKNYENIKTRLINIMNRIENNYAIRLISQKKYNSIMEFIDKILDTFNDLIYPLTFKLYNLISISDLNLKIYKIKKDIVNLVCLCGSLDINSILSIVVKDYKNFLNIDNPNYLQFLNKIFIPINCKVLILKKDQKNDNSIKISNLNILNASLIEKLDGANIDIPFKDRILSINGYFKKDPLNFYKKYPILKKKINDIKSRIIAFNINNTFTKSYIDQISTRDIIVLSIDKIIRKIKKDYDHSQKLKNQLLSSLVKEFLMSNIQDQRKILTLFLISENEKTQHLAYLLFDMITTSSDSIKPQFMAEDIFKSLHWSIQKRFEIAFKNVENYRKKLLSLNENSISYEDRIIQMNVDDYIKSKALDKLKEIKGSKESIKAQNYLDNLLKIPFNEYKNENIISFLNEYSKNIKILFIDLKNTIINIENLDDTLNFLKDEMLNLFEYFNSDIFITENSINNLINHIEIVIIKINNNISDNKKYDEIKKQIYPILKEESEKTLDKIKNLKNINSKIDNCKDKKYLESIEFEISDNIKKELENLKSKIYGLPSSPKLVKNTKIFTSEYEYEDNIKPNNNLKIIEEFNKWRSVESQLINLMNEWTKYKHSKKEYMTNVRNILDSCIYGQNDAKKHIERLIAQWINGKMENNVFGFQGPPGVGKTTLCKKGLAKCLIDENGDSRPFTFIALGGATRGVFLNGHDYTYVGSTWGKIVDILIETKCMNPVIYIDELDKVSKTEHGREIIGILTHLTDDSQNSEFSDRYFSGIKFDLSKAMIVFSYNDAKLIDPILKDRITEVNVKSITKKEKLHITKEYLLPEILNIVGYNKHDIQFDDNSINYIIETFTYEAGVRKLKERLFELIREINLIKILGEEQLELPFIVTEEFIKTQFSDRAKVLFTKIAKEPQVGLANGLYATSAGTGGITIIEVMKTPSDSKLSLELTGNQGNVMKESMKCAKTIAWNLLPLDIKKSINSEWDEIGKFGLHIHCPDAAMPKDGPSAGIAITSAILSRLCNIKLKNTVAMTGEIDLNGKVHAIGGLESKLDGAKRAGVKKVLIPFDNKEDYYRIIKGLSNDEKYEYLLDFEIVPVKEYKEVITEVLVDNNLEFNFIN